MGIKMVFYVIRKGKDESSLVIMFRILLNGCKDNVIIIIIMKIKKILKIKMYREMEMNKDLILNKEIAILITTKILCLIFTLMELFVRKPGVFNERFNTSIIVFRC